MASKVKSIRWAKSGAEESWVGYTPILGMCYYVTQYFASDSYGWAVTCGDQDVADCDDPTTAKERAQEHFNEMILGCLDTTPTHRHIKRGTMYVSLGPVSMQISKSDGYMWESPPTRFLTDKDELVLYQSTDDGKFYVRFPDEFNDPERFEKL